MKTVYLDCFSGASGDMILGALIDAGADRDTVAEALTALPIEGVSLDVDAVMKGAIRATLVAPGVDGASSSRDYAEIVALLEGADLDVAIKRRSLAAFRALGDAEAKIHGVPIEDVHFHEVGSEDAILDIVGACAAIEDLAPDRIVVSSIATGRGYTDSMHGTIPVPAPAVLEILHGAELYERGTHELITPTGAALLATWADSFGPMPPMTIGRVGYGAGTSDLEWPNVLRAVVGEGSERVTPAIATELLETTIDDMSPELIPYVIERTLDAGALDAWVTPVHMKKGRIGVVLSVLVEHGASQEVLDVVFKETTTFGVRISSVDREILDRKELEVDVSGHTVRIKVGYRNGRVVSASPEYEDAAAAARATGVPLKDVYRAALEGLET
jgi:uncharacterized protein (TIGR00299 family) protein